LYVWKKVRFIISSRMLCMSSFLAESIPGLHKRASRTVDNDGNCWLISLLFITCCRRIAISDCWIIIRLLDNYTLIAYPLLTFFLDVWKQNAFKQLSRTDRPENQTKPHESWYNCTVHRCISVQYIQECMVLWMHGCKNKKSSDIFKF
jgi:hypothetical protein